jgi:hypothetical protein
MLSHSINSGELCQTMNGLTAHFLTRPLVLSALDTSLQNKSRVVELELQIHIAALHSEFLYLAEVQKVMLR